MVTLYDIDMDGRMVSYPDGNWVRCDDYAALETRIAELESRLEIDTEHDIDGIDACNATIELQDTLIDELKSRVAELEKDAARYRVCYSDNDGDSCTESPADADFVSGLTVGEEFELLVCFHPVRRAFRVIKAPDDVSDDYEVEEVQP